MKSTLIGLVGLTLLAQTASANTSPCLPRDALVATLASTYSEELQGRGLRDEDRLFEFFSTKDGKSWTMLQTFSNGVSCILASGSHWITPEAAPEAKGIPG